MKTPIFPIVSIWFRSLSELSCGIFVVNSGCRDFLIILKVLYIQVLFLFSPILKLVLELSSGFFLRPYTWTICVVNCVDHYIVLKVILQSILQIFHTKNMTPILGAPNVSRELPGAKIFILAFFLFVMSTCAQLEDEKISEVELKTLIWEPQSLQCYMDDKEEVEIMEIQDKFEKGVLRRLEALIPRMDIMRPVLEGFRTLHNQHAPWIEWAIEVMVKAI